MKFSGPKRAIYLKDFTVHKDHYLWRCMCGNENLITSLDCHKCREQRWAQLGFDRETAQEIAYRLTPAYLLSVA